VFSDHWEALLRMEKLKLREAEKENVEKILSCQDPEKLGFTLYRCPHHPEETYRVVHTCKSRFCNRCGKILTDNWLCACHLRLPNIPYYHLTLTIPSELRTLLKDIRPLMGCLFTTLKDVILGFYEKEKKCTPILMMVEHSFGRDLKWNPHLHAILSAGGLRIDSNSSSRQKIHLPLWKDVSFVPYKMMKERWKVVFINTLKESILSILQSLDDPEISQKLPPEVRSCKQLQLFRDTKILNAFFRDLYSKTWYVQLSAERSNLKDTIGYIGRYAKRPVISEAKIVDYQPNKNHPELSTITFEYDDHKTKSTIRNTLRVFEFMKKLIQHIPEKYFHVIRSAGLTANRVIQKHKPILRKLFGAIPRILQKLFWRQRQKIFSGEDPLCCRVCGSSMLFAYRLCFSRSQNRLVRV
jgi:hypothetical protein